MLLNFTSINPIDALVLASAVNGLIAPFILAIIMLAANHPAIMAGHPNGRLSNVLGWLTTAVMGVAAIALLATWGH
jgi:Mn2+/Fe2+ NRAMP family transporter